MTKRTRVLMIQPTGISGIWHYATALSQSLVQSGVDVMLATLVPFEDFSRDGVPVWSLGTRRDYTSVRLAVLRRLADHVDKLRRLRRAMRTFRPEVVHVHGPIGKLDFVYFRFMKALGARVIYTAHDARPLRREAQWSDWARYQAADDVLVHSSRCQQFLVESGVSRDKITCVVHGNYLHFCHHRGLLPSEARRLLGLPEDGRVVLFFGAIAPYKGLEVLIAAFARLRQEDPRIYLVIAGEPLEDFGRYQRLIEALGGADRIVQDLKYVAFEDFPKYFLAADMVALPYRRISQSGILQLAYGFAKPVVVTDVGGLAEAVREDGTGVIVDDLTDQQLAEAIRRLLSDPGAAARMGMRGRFLAETKYSWRSVAANVARIYAGIQH